MDVEWIENTPGVELPKDGELCWVVYGVKAAEGKLMTSYGVAAAKCSVTVSPRSKLRVVVFIPLITQYDMRDGWPIEPKGVTHFAVMEKPEAPEQINWRASNGPRN